MQTTKSIPIDSSLNAGYAAIEKQPIIHESWVTQIGIRINRMEFFQNILILFIFTTFVYVIINIFSPTLSKEDIGNFTTWNPLIQPHIVLIGNISWLLIYGIFYWILRHLSIKRFADFGNSWKMPKILIPTFFIINIYAYWLGIFSAYFGNPVLKYINSDSPFYYIISVIDGLAIWSLIWVVLMIIYWLIRPGTKK
jgi:hypothetical protein